MYATAERARLMSPQQIEQGRQAIREIVQGIQLSRITERLTQKKKA